jgi:alpha-galactosidase
MEEIGVKFGLWFELEMVNKDSDLYRAHPDWIIHVPGRYHCQARHQHVLDYSRPEVVDYIHDMVAKILSESKISYIKWDMNRYMTAPFSLALPADRQGEMMHRYTLGLYNLYSRLTSEFPHVLFESCASGGARFDPGLLYFAPQAWCSDDTDASERCKIQYGTTYVYPVSMIGAHVSAVPNHQLHRTTPLATRANVAMFGTFGYELDLEKMPEEEIQVVKEQIRFMKKYRRLIQIESDFYRLLSPFKGNETGWICVSPDKKTALAGFYQRLNKVNASWIRFKLAGLSEDVKYKLSYRVCDETRGYAAYGDELMSVGIPIDREDLTALGGDFASIVFEISAE